MKGLRISVTCVSGRRQLLTLGLILLVAAIGLSYSLSPHPTASGQLQTGSVQGRVYGFTCPSDVVPLTGATVSATLIQTGYTPLPTTTDTEGDYHLTLAPGEYKLFVHADFFQTQDSYSFTISSGTVISDFNFYLYAATLTSCTPVQYLNLLHKVVIYSNSTVGQVMFDSSVRQVNFPLVVPNESTGGVLIVIPKGLLDGSPVVFVDSNQFTSVIVEGTNYFYVQFVPSVGTHDVKVQGLESIPEFSGLAQGSMLIIGFILAACSAVFLRNRKRRNS
jgi:hypothetical protein